MNKENDMDIHILSDLHLTKPLVVSDLKSDLCILAGDISETPLNAMLYGRRSVPNASFITQISGNHDCIGYSLEEGISIIEKNQTDTHVFLEDRIWYHPLKPLRVIGATLWTDLEACGNSALFLEKYYDAIHDFKRIKNFNPEEWINRHNNSKKFILDSLNTHFNGSTIVVTHHLIGPNSIHDIWKSHHMTSAFVSHSLKDIYTHPDCSLIVHGHTHSNAIWRENKDSPLVVCNPMGGTMNSYHYPNPLNLEFDRNFLIEINAKKHAFVKKVA